MAEEMLERQFASELNEVGRGHSGIRPSEDAIPELGSQARTPSSSSTPPKNNPKDSFGDSTTTPRQTSQQQDIALKYIFNTIRIIPQNDR
jgi:hypothetical protein